MKKILFLFLVTILLSGCNTTHKMYQAPLEKDSIVNLIIKNNYFRVLEIDGEKPKRPLTKGRAVKSWLSGGLYHIVENEMINNVEITPGKHQLKVIYSESFDDKVIKTIKPIDYEFIAEAGKYYIISGEIQNNLCYPSIEEISRKAFTEKIN